MDGAIPRPAAAVDWRDVTLIVLRVDPSHEEDRASSCTQGH
jgi:hypothetical protein